ncbi:HIT family protein [Xanthomonas euvesicatoria pv. eucalypti]|uniref:HIT domain-containing protein n=1 Tax=Xanthomonas euvesicatoria TaxID=456327 RepID=UPI0026E3FC37|nr:HIT family protein [Xanthomonas euvesicatoria]MDO7932664.1 HIT family protein [Xanthomonas euvesicatoria pv. eucalypti]MDO7937119.1 HIT family protein [Xanthomonas euvesicatoria pv. eucalypti]MDO7941119.1 HIT family protein [Xanthomonas euvesicatoria pv. eucalypti]MDO7945696.1 HIT family protein [Xanthomonas euvesicatoria pv. eucalypti]MDO7948781.1 HIT family protein [Xanthomonas euvesicatoria pv. eucalypti]
MSDTAPDRPAGDFQLDPRLAADSVFVADGPLSQVRLMDDTRFPWLVLVPRVADVSEWIDLDGGQQRLLLAEINQLSQLLRAEPGVGKLNIGALGNIVRQLHVHLVGRHPGDAAWPGPVWGSGSAQRLAAEALQQHVAAWAQRLR